MFFPVVTLLTSLALAAVAGWFSIAGLVTIMAGQPVAALILGVTLEAGKLVTASWLYRNWGDANWRLKLPLLYFMFALMMATSMGVFGYLSKAHLEQGSATIDNSAKIAELDRRIANEQRRIADNERMVAQLDGAVDAFIAKNQTNRALTVRRSQQSQRNQLTESNQTIQTEIDRLTNEKFQLSSELRKLELEVGPIKYIAKIIYGNDDTSTLAAAVRIFILLIVSTLDPLAITLLIAANFTLLKVRAARHAPGTETVSDTKDAVIEDTPMPQSEVSCENADAPVSISLVQVVDTEHDAPNVNVNHASPITVADALCELDIGSGTLIDDIADYHLMRSSANIQAPIPPVLAEVIEDYDDNVFVEEEMPVIETSTVPSDEFTAGEIRDFLEQICRPTPVASLKIPDCTQVTAVGETAVNMQDNSGTSVIMSDTVRELKGRHVILTPVIQPTESELSKQASTQQTTVKSWIETYKDLS